MLKVRLVNCDTCVISNNGKELFVVSSMLYCRFRRGEVVATRYILRMSRCVFELFIAYVVDSRIGEVNNYCRICGGDVDVE